MTRKANPPVSMDELPDSIVNRRQLLQTAAAGSAAAIAGCVGGDNGEEAPDDELFIRTYINDEEGPHWDDTDDPIPYSNYVYHAVEEFQEETGIDAVHQPIAIEEWRTQLSTVMGSEGAPQVIDMLPLMEGADAIHEGQFEKLNELEGLNQEIIENHDTDNWTFEDGDIFNIMQGDDVYAIPYYGTGLAIWYNKVVLEDVGIDHEQLKHSNTVEWEEFNDIMAEVRDAGYIPFAFGNRVGGHIPYKLSVAVNKSVGHEEVLDVLDPATDRQINDQDFIEAFELIEEWWEQDFINEDTLALDEAEAESYFFRNEAAFTTDGIWIRDLWNEVADPDELGDQGEDWDYMWWPYRPDVYEDGQHELLAFPVGAAAIGSQAEEQGFLDEAIEWMNFFYGDEQAQIRAEHTDRVTSHTEYTPQGNPVAGDMHEQMHADEHVQARRTDDLLLPEFGETLNSRGQDLFEGTATPEEILDDCQEALEEGHERYQ